jgi:predicted HTH domain antitoxin
MATITIPDEVLTNSKLSERELLIEAACRLFDAGKLTLPMAARMAGFSRIEMEDALLDRKIAIYRPTVEDLEQDLKTIARWKK